MAGKVTLRRTALLRVGTPVLRGVLEGPSWVPQAGALCPPSLPWSLCLLTAPVATLHRPVGCEGEDRMWPGVLTGLLLTAGLAPSAARQRLSCPGSQC